MLHVRWRIGLFALLPLLWVGCAGPRRVADAPAEPDVPATWAEAAAVSAASAAASREGWWQRFDDPLLARLVAQAMQANTTVLGAQAALRQARALRDVAAAALQPLVTGSASARHGTSGGDSTGNVFQADLDASWEVDLFGGRRAGVASADAVARSGAASLGDVQVSIAAEVGLGYIALRGAQARLAVGEDNLASQRETLQLTEWRAQAGLLSTLEAEQARAATAQTGAQLPGLRSSVALQSHALAVLTGQPPATLDALLAAPRAIPQPAADLALSLPADTLRQRPDVRAAEQQVLAAQGRVAQADAARYPSFQLGGSLGLSALTLGSLGSSALATTLLASVSLPVWDGGAAQAQVRAQQAALDSARSSYRGTVLTALKDVEDALVALRGDRERLERLQVAADAATRAATLARQRYGSGLVDFQTVLETQRSQLATQDSRTVALADVGADHVRLYKALGGAWRSSEPTLSTDRTEPR